MAEVSIIAGVDHNDEHCYVANARAKEEEERGGYCRNTYGHGWTRVSGHKLLSAQATPRNIYTTRVHLYRAALDPLINPATGLGKCKHHQLQLTTTAKTLSPWPPLLSGKRKRYRRNKAYWQSRSRRRGNVWRLRL
ncbi:unnamed protein product [Laminaria digitata]